MNIQLSKIIGQKIFYHKEKIGILKQISINDETGKIEGIINNKNEFIPFEWVKSIQDKIILNKKIFTRKKGSNWLNYKVKTIDEQKIGIVNDIIFDFNTQRTTKIFIEKKILLFLTLYKRIISTNNIIQIKKNTIIINEEQKESLPLNVAFSP